MVYLHLVTAGIAAFSAAFGALAQCPPNWIPGQGPTIEQGRFNAATLFDPDGDGPARADLIVGGQFGRVGLSDPLMSNLARWDGAAWSPVVVLPVFQGYVNALAVFDFDAEGPNPPRLIFAGSFTIRFTPAAANNIGMADGQNVAPLGDGFNGVVHALHVFDPDADGPAPAELYAAGQFSSSGQQSVRSVARWDGSGWQPVAPNLSGEVFALATIDLDGAGPLPPYLAAGGRCAVNGQPTTVAFFDGSTWLRSGPRDGEVFSFALFDFDADGPDPARLVAAGNLLRTNANVSLNGRAYFDGTAWQPIAPPQTSIGSGRAIAAFDPDGPGPLPDRLVLAGWVPVPGQSQPVPLAELIDGAWSPLIVEPYSGDIRSMQQLTLPAEADPLLVIAGTLTTHLGRDPLRLATYDGESLESFGAGFNDVIYDMAATTVNGAPAIVAVGAFSFAPPNADSRARAVALFDGERWSSLGTTTDSSTIDVVSPYDPDADGPAPEVIVVGGFFTSIGGVPAHHVAMWDGDQWSRMGSDTDLNFEDFTLFDLDADGPARPTLITCAGFASDGDGTSQYLRQWNGSAWVQFGPPFTSDFGSGAVTRLTTFDPDGDGPRQPELVVAGSFNHVGSVAANNVAAFDGGTWRRLGSGLTVNPQAICAWARNGDGHQVIIVGGYFNTAGGVPANGVAVWNGQAWSTLGDGFAHSHGLYLAEATGFAVYDGDLHAVGSFDLADGAPANGIARWDGSAWRPLGTGLDLPQANCIATLPASKSIPETLCVGGGFQSAGGLASASFARYAAPLLCCPPDHNNDGILNSQDFFDFLTTFFGRHPSADFNHDGAIDTQDFFDYLAAYLQGC